MARNGNDQTPCFIVVKSECFVLLFQGTHQAGLGVGAADLELNRRTGPSTEHRIRTDGPCGGIDGESAQRVVRDGPDDGGPRWAGRVDRENVRADRGAFRDRAGVKVLLTSGALLDGQDASARGRDADVRHGNLE